MKLFSQILYYIFVTAVIGLALLLFASLFPISGNYQVKIVQSGSMGPTIKTGSLVIIRPEQSYKDGDVITFGKDTKRDVPTTHRIVATRAVEGIVYFTTKGDANEDSDSKEIKQSEVIGKVLFSIPYVGYLLDFAKKPLGFALLIGVPAGIVVIDEMSKIYKEIKVIKDRKRKKDPSIDSGQNNDDEEEEKEKV